MKTTIPICLLLSLTAISPILSQALAQSTHTQSGQNPLRINVLTYNIHHAEGVDGRLDLERIAKVIRDSGADIIALQEVDQGVLRSNNIDQPQQLAQRLGMHVAFGANIDLQGGKYGNAVLSRFPITAWHNHLLPNVDGGEQRGVLQVDIELPKQMPLRFLATHFDHRPKPAQRLASAEMINELLATTDAGQCFLLAGDLNAVPDSETLDKLRQHWILPTDQNQATIPVAQPNKKIDYVLTKKSSAKTSVSMTEVESKILDEAIASDHRPLLSVIEIKNKNTNQPNVLLICVDDLRPELHCYGVDYMHSPNIDRLAGQGVLFKNHYVQAPTCGASRYTLLTGQYGGRSNEAIFQRAAKIVAGEKIDPSLPEWFRQQGYRTVSVGKVSHHPGGRGGPDWNDQAITEMPGAWDEHLCPSGAWQHPRGFMHGLANGEIRQDAKNMDLFQSTSGDDSIYPDGLTTAAALDQLQKLSQNAVQPFFLAVGILRPHLPFGAPAKYMEPYINAQLPATPHPEKPTGKTTWHNSGEFMKYHRWGRNPNQDAQFAIDVRKHYAACVTYADAQIGRLLEQLDAVGAKENTIVVVWGDHGWHLGEHAIWGKHALFDESLRSPLIISAPTSKFPSVHSTAIVETIDIFPTLCELANLPQPDFVHGQSLLGALRGEATPKSIAVSYSPQARTLRSERYRFILHRDGQMELYDHQSLPGETLNIAAQSPAVCTELQELLDERLPEGKK